MQIPIPHRVRNGIATALHNRAIADVKKTPPIRQAPSGLTILSMLRHADVLMYLVALKSIYPHIGPASIVVLDDGSLRAADRRLIDAQAGPVRYISVDEVDTRPCPRGGTWERLLSILDLTREDYVIQLDADMLGLGVLDEITRCIRENRAFTLAASHTAAVETLAEASAVARSWGPLANIYIVEQMLDEMPGSEGLRYIRGCSAFAGFPRGSGGRKRVSGFSSWFERRLGARWREWGTEQFGSNFVIANCPDPLVLPWSKYRSFYGESSVETASLVHFFGTYRFEQGVYTAESRRAIRAMARAP